VTEKVSLKIYGMTCALCSAVIESGLEKVDGVSRVKVNYATEKAILEYENTKIQLPDIQKIIKHLGFSAVENQSSPCIDRSIDPGEIERKHLWHQFIFAAVLSFPLLLAMILGGLGFCHDTFDPSTQTGWGQFVEYLRFRASGLHDWRLQLALATPVQFVIGFRFYKSSFYALRVKKATMDLLVAIGSTAAYFYSVYISLFQSYTVILGMKNIYFEASSVIITLVLLGKYLEISAKGKTSKAIQTLIALKPKTAMILKGKAEISIPIEEVRPGDLIRVKPGERVPVDGIVIDGYSTVDESMLTGESFPVDKKAQESVTGGSLNQYGSFIFKATRVGEGTVLSQIIKMVEEAQNSKAPIQKIADRVCGYFIPFVLAVSVLTFLIQYFIIYHHTFFVIDKPIIDAVAVLVVSCPCALGLATPTALMVGMGKGAEKGILIKNGEELETVCKINAVVFDKTGTLTTGKLEVTDFILLRQGRALFNETEVLKLASIAERKSEHPLGKAIYQWGKSKIIFEIDDAEKFEAIPGKGVYAEFQGKSLWIGNPKLMTENGIEIGNAEDRMVELYNQGKTAVLMAINNKLAAIFGVSDQVKANSVEVVKTLQKMGLEVFILTGDNLKTAQAVGNKIGIQKIIAEVLPQHKALEIEKLKQKGFIVAMVGDGINDAPALATANTGFAMGSGSDVAVETGGIVLLKDDLSTIPVAIQLAKRTMRKIRQNLFWAFIYNLLSIPVAATGNLNPVVGAVAMAMSSISVLLNSLSLKKFNG
jgi:Cu+-exporting ATPase